MRLFERFNINENSYTLKEPQKIFKHISGFEVKKIGKNTNIINQKENVETVIVIISGRCFVKADDERWERIGDRKTPFDGLPYAVYIPPACPYEISGEGCEIAICEAKSKEKGGTPFLISPENIQVMDVGRDNWYREVHLIVPPNSKANNIIIGETLNPPGNWSGTPPHKHESNNPPEESLHEELYYFKTDRPQGWGIKRLYSPERNINELIYLQDNTITFIPWGYHQIVAGPGYTLYYLFFLAGEGVQLKSFEDPNHSWIKNDG